MASEPTQSLVIWLPAQQARRIRQLVDTVDSGYESVDEFIRVAVENQLNLELGKDSFTGAHDSPTEVVGDRSQVIAHPITLKDVDSRIHNSAASELSPESYLHRPTTKDLEVLESQSVAGSPLSSFTNRLAPILAGPRVLANMSRASGPPTVEAYLGLTAKAARAFGLRLKAEDDMATRRGRNRRATAWPTGDDEGKSLIRFRSCFMFATEKGGGYAGPLLELGFIAIADGNAYLTGTGASFAELESPAIDLPGQTEVLSAEHKAILARSIVRSSGELHEIETFLDALETASGSQDKIDLLLGEAHHEWSEAQIVSHRAAMVGRLRDIEVIEVETLSSAKSQIVSGGFYEEFLKLIGDAYRA